MGFSLSTRDLGRLVGVHPDLVRVVRMAAVMSPVRFVVLEGVRTVERQRELMKQGASRTMASRHITGHAVDLAPLLDTDGDGDVEVSWHWPHYTQLAIWVKRAAAHEQVPLAWGGDWSTFKDGPHWELPRLDYPV